MNIIITGASRGIGYETAKILSVDHKVIVISRSITNRTFKVNRDLTCLPVYLPKGMARQESRPAIIPIAFDLGRGDIKKLLLPKIKKHFKTVDLLINNAATFIKKPFHKTTRKEFEELYRVNLFSIAELTQVILPMMNSIGRAHVLNIASMGGIQGSVKFPGLSAYSSSKGALVTLTECLAEEYKNKNISFNAIAFGAVQTEMLKAAFPGIKAPITAAQAAEFVSFFARNGQKYFNGKILQMALSVP